MSEVQLDQMAGLRWKLETYALILPTMEQKFLFFLDLGKHYADQTVHLVNAGPNYKDAAAVALRMTKIATIAAERVYWARFN